MTSSLPTTPSVIRMTEDEYKQRCHDDPVFWAQEVCDTDPTEQQKEMLYAVARQGGHVLAASGHGIGKSTALAILALWFLANRKDAKVPCTAPTAHQLEDILWNEMSRLIARMTKFMREQFSVSKGRITMRGSTGFIVARTARPEKPDALQGFHGENLLFIIDEAAGVDEKVFEVVYGALTSDSARVICTGNPTRLDGFFHKMFHSGDTSWIRFNFSCLDSPLVEDRYPEDVERDYGVDSDMYRVRVLGQFPLTGKNNLIPAEAVYKALSFRPRYDAFDMYPVVLGVDPAWEGDDRSVISMRQGRYARILFSDVHLDGDQLAREVVRFSVSHNAKYIFVDKTGVGASCCDFLKVRGVSHQRVSFGESPDDRERFENKRAEMWWRLREWLLHDDIALKDHEKLMEDLIAPQYEVNDRGKICMEGKKDMRKRGVRSPDLGDSLAITFYFPYELTLGNSSATGVRKSKRTEERNKRWRNQALGLKIA